MWNNSLLLVPVSKNVLVLCGKKFVLLVGDWWDAGGEVACGKRSGFFSLSLKSLQGCFYAPTKGKVVWLPLFSLSYIHTGYEKIKADHHCVFVGCVRYSTLEGELCDI